MDRFEVRIYQWNKKPERSRKAGVTHPSEDHACDYCRSSLSNYVQNSCRFISFPPAQTHPMFTTRHLHFPKTIEPHLTAKNLIEVFAPDMWPERADYPDKSDDYNAKTGHQNCAEDVRWTLALFRCHTSSKFLPSATRTHEPHLAAKNLIRTFPLRIYNPVWALCIVRDLTSSRELHTMCV